MYTNIKKIEINNFINILCIIMSILIENNYFDKYLNTIFKDNPEYINKIFKLYKPTHIINLSDYIYKHIMYMFIMEKIGYSNDFDNRKKKLCYDYNCDMFLIGIKLVNSEKDELKFHTFMKNIYPSLIFNYKLKNNNKHELYFFDDIVINEFNNYNIELTNKLLIEKEQTKQIEYQTKQIEYQEKTKQLIVEEKTKQLSIELELKKIELKLKKIELKIKK